MLVAGVLLVHYNIETICDDCKQDYNSTMINDVKSCVSIINGVINSYTQCHENYIEPGFGIGCFLLVICWVAAVAAGAPMIVVFDN